MNQGGCSFVERVIYKGVDCVKKVSTYVDYSIELEKDVLRKLGTLNSSHFPRLIDYKKDVMYIEYINGTSFHSFNNNDTISQDAKNDTIKRAILVAGMVNETLGIVHNDLHQLNVLVRPVSHAVDRYVFPDGSVYEYKTHGFEPVIIDFGMAFDGTMRVSNGLTKYGILPFEADMLADARRLVPGNFGDSVTSGGHLSGFGDMNDYLLYEITNDYVNPFYVSKYDHEDLEYNRDFLDLFTAKIRLPLTQYNGNIEAMRIRAKRTFQEFLALWTDNVTLNNHDDRLKLIKALLNKSSSSIGNKYCIPVSVLSRLKYLAHSLVKPIACLMYEKAAYYSEKKKNLYSKIKYKKCRDLLTPRSVPTCSGDVVREYNVGSKNTITIVYT